MTVLRNLPVSRKLFYGFGVINALLIVLGAAALICFHRVNVNINEIADNAMPSVETLADLRVEFAGIRRNEAMVVLCESAECTAKFRERVQKYTNAFQKDMQKYEPMVAYPGERELFTAIRNGSDQYLQLSDETMRDLDAGRTDAVRSKITGSQMTGLFDEISKTIEQDKELNAHMGQVAGQTTVREGKTASVVVWVVLIVSIVLSIVIGVSLTKMIAPPLQAATEALEKVARKDLTVRIDVQGSDEVGRMGEALNTSVASIRSVLTSMSHAAETLSSASEQLSASSVQSSGNAKTQSSRTQQIAAAAQEMTATIAEISKNAEEATRASQQSAASASNGGQVMEQANTTMEKIGETTGYVSERMKTLEQRSEEIGKVISVIQEISEQTNLLALNAAIEAARAGEHGRGFAVVAGEVRRLAERTKSATEEIAGTISSIQEETRQTADAMEGSRAEVESGRAKTADAHHALQSTINEVQAMEHMISMIATAATEQTSAAAEISESASQISNLSEENATAARESAEACHTLSKLASTLDGQIRQFRLA